jgi:hypothetical protein
MQTLYKAKRSSVIAPPERVCTLNGAVVWRQWQHKQRLELHQLLLLIQLALTVHWQFLLKVCA